MGKPLKYTKVRVVKITEDQNETLNKIKSYNINVSNFIREAIKEKIERDHNNLKPKTKKQYIPF